LLVLASLALLDPALTRARPWVQAVVRSAFVAGVVVSLAANVAAAGAWTWAAVLVAGWPPLALLLSAEILIHSTTHDTSMKTRHASAGRPGESRSPDHGTGTGKPVSPGTDTPAAVDSAEPGPVTGPAAGTTNATRSTRRGEAQRVMWEHYRRALAAGRTLTGAELDRIAGTRDYGRAVLARWRRTGRIPETTDAEPAGQNESPANTSGGGVTVIATSRDVQESERAVGPDESGRAAA
jgi:hypothetical protein